ncbi:B-box zinc finger protein [Reinekea marina]|uniref:B box-type domain-containing protein n=1 Tax=Reinekea marina TaxID=1310421 RepID=A0ABV7WX26_9GAMM|nr:B-box zinc finger protein [Reinekea marina]MDN3647452.1 B-box zinc finger protein [Reinekea marina]
MDTCKYHPLVPTSFHCNSCEQDTCSECVDNSSSHGQPRCIRCGELLESVANSDNVEPFWRRIEQAFKYPLNSEALMMIVGVSVGMAVVSSLPFGALTLFIITLALYGAMLNYSFMAMTLSSDGDFEPPTAVDAVAGGLGLSFKMILMIILMVGILIVTALQVGQVAVNLLGLLFIVGLPAILICFAHTGSIIQSLNPVMFVNLMAKVGFPYAVLLGLLLVMTSSVSAISAIIGNDFAAVSSVFQSIVANYYTLVMFHIMGYMLYQYQDRLGFTSGNDITGYDHERNPEDTLLAKVGVFLKEGDYARSLGLLKEGAATFPTNKKLAEKYFDLLLLLKQHKALATYADIYFMNLAREAQMNRLYSQYRRLSLVLPKYKPQSSELRYQLAVTCEQQSNFKAVVWMINGLHVDDLNYVNIVQAYQLLTKALQALGQDAMAKKCGLLLEKLKQRMPAKAPKEAARPAGKAVFDAQPVSTPTIPPAKVEFGATAPEPEIEAAPESLPPIEFKP